MEARVGTNYITSVSSVNNTLNSNHCIITQAAPLQPLFAAASSPCLRVLSCRVIESSECVSAVPQATTPLFFFFFLQFEVLSAECVSCIRALPRHTRTGRVPLVSQHSCRFCSVCGRCGGAAAAAAESFGQCVHPVQLLGVSVRAQTPASSTSVFFVSRR